MATVGAGLRHRPDLVLRDDSGGWVLIDVKTLDPAGVSHVATDHCDTRRLAAHTRAERTSARDEYGPLPAGMRLVVFTVSVFGSLGGPARAFLAEVGRRVGGGVPASLLDEATWAAPRFAPFCRMAVTCAARRGLATAVRRHWRRVFVCGAAAPDPPAAPPDPP